MNSIHNNGKDDKTLDRDLGTLDDLYRSVESDGPPELLDQAILNRAHRAVETNNSWLDFGWMHGLTTVALVVLTFSVVLSLRNSGEFDPSSVPVNDRPVAPQRQQKKAAPEGELKAKDDAVQDGYLIEEMIVTGAQSEDSVSQEPTAARLENASPAAPAGEALKPDTAMEPSSSDSGDWKEQLEEDRAIDERSKSEKTAEERTRQAQSGLQPSVEINAPVSESIETQADRETAAASEHFSQTATPVTVDVLSDSDTLGKLDFSQQTELLELIVKRKLAGDESWKTELDAFIKAYPDFPLPDELKP